MIPHPVTLYWHWVDQSLLYPVSLSVKLRAVSTIFNDRDQTLERTLYLLSYRSLFVQMVGHDFMLQHFLGILFFLMYVLFLICCFTAQSTYYCHVERGQSFIDTVANGACFNTPFSTYQSSNSSYYQHTCHISHCEIKSHRIWPIWKPIPIRFFKSQNFQTILRIFEEININHTLFCLWQAYYI